MANLQLQILSGVQAGKRLIFHDSPVSFGREGDNHIVLETNYASRRHGELRFENGLWLLVNLSPNGTRLNRRVLKKPLPVNPGDEIAIGDTPVLRLLAAAHDEEPAADSTGSAAGAGANGGRAGTAAGPLATSAVDAPSPAAKVRFYALVGICIGSMVFAAIAFMVTSGPQKTQAIAQIDDLSRLQIREEVRRMPKVAFTDNAQAKECLQKARELAARLDSGIDAPYRAHLHYQLALAYEGKTEFASGLDYTRFREVQEKLIDLVTNQYEDGYARLRSARYNEASDAMIKLTRMFPDPDSKLYQSAQQIQAEAAKHFKRRKNI